MPLPSQTSELEAINSMLATIGESPVHSTEDGSVDVEMAKDFLRKTSRKVQEGGWSWNTAENLTLPLTSDGQVPVPENTLKVKVSDFSHHRVTLRGYRLYNRKTNTYTFTTPVVVDLVEYLEFEELPEVARQYIMMAASRTYQDKMVGSPALASAAGKDELVAWGALYSAEAETSNFNVLQDSITEVLGNFRGNYTRWGY